MSDRLECVGFQPHHGPLADEIHPENHFGLPAPFLHPCQSPTEHSVAYPNLVSGPNFWAELKIDVLPKGCLDRIELLLQFGRLVRSNREQTSKVTRGKQGLGQARLGLQKDITREQRAFEHDGAPGITPNASAQGHAIGDAQPVTVIGEALFGSGPCMSHRPTADNLCIRKAKQTGALGMAIYLGILKGI